MRSRTERYPLPSLPRLVGGLTLAGTVPGALVALLGMTDGDLRNALGFGAFVGLFYGVAPALILGLPAVYVLRSAVTPNLKASVIAGAIVASLPAALAALSTGPGLLVLVPLALPLGAIGGAVFWLFALRNLKPLSLEDTSQQRL